MDTFTETVGRFSVRYERRPDDPEEQIRRVEEVMGEPASEVLKERLREEKLKWSFEMRGNPCGLFLDHARSLGEARNKVRELAKVYA